MVTSGVRSFRKLYESVGFSAGSLATTLVWIRTV
jgi:hypothetical protein